MSDTLAHATLPELKPAILEQLRAAGVAPFVLPGTTVDLPYAVCSSAASDLESMDASLLMQPDSHPPLAPSDLPDLLSNLLAPASVAALKHASARKLIRWRSNPRDFPFVTSLSRSLSPGLSPTISSPSLHSSWSLTTQQHAFSALTHPRLAAHTQREERLANIRLVNWAGAMQRGLAAERARYEELARQERISWLKDKLADCADIEMDPDKHGLDADCAALIAVHDSGSAPRTRCGINVEAMSRRRRRLHSETTDPLGLMHFADGLQYRGWVALRIIGGAGLVGGVALFVARMSGMQWWEGWYGIWSCTGEQSSR
jgi:hypothetical protein